MNSNNENVLLSYPRSGNHLCRFFIELLSELPTYGCKGNKTDVEINKNVFDESIPFNILTEFNKNECYIKYHNAPSININTKNLILIVRNPREVLLNQCNYKLSIKRRWDSYCEYFKNIDYYNNHKGKKLLLYYEDMLTNKKEFINELYEFLSINNEAKKEYTLSNIEKLYTLSSNGKNRGWGGVKSNFQLDFYYSRIPDSIKHDFDSYLSKTLKNYPSLQKKYNIV